MRVGATGVMRIVDDFLVLLLVLFITSTVLIL